MEDIIGLLILVMVIIAVALLLGVIGFFRANRAIAEIRQLRALLANRPAPAPVPAPMLAPEPDPAPPPSPIAAIPPVEQPAPPPPPPRRRRDWEEVLTAKWGVWLGAAALLLSGVFLVRYASDEGLLGPGVRCVAIVLLGIALIAAAEWLRRRETGPANLPDYAPGALAAGGVAVLFAAAYMAGPLYAMVPGVFGFALLAAASLAGLALSLRMGQLVAAVGVVGAFVTPLLVQTADPSLPGLFAYLLFVAASALAVVRYAAWIWLGWATTIACAGFVFVVALDGAAGQAWAPALFVPAVALLALALLPGAALDHAIGRRLAYVPVAALGAVGLLLSFTAPEAWTHTGILLLAALTVGKAATEPRLDRLSWLGAALFLLLIAGWGLPPWHPTGEVVTAGDRVFATLPGAWAPEALQGLLLTAAASAAGFAAAGLWGERLRPNRLRWSGLAATVPVAALAILYARVAGFQADDVWAGAALALAVGSTLAAAAAARAGDPARAGAHAAGATAALALGCGATLHAQWLTIALALFVPALAVIEHRADLPPLRWVALAMAALAAIRLLLNPAVLAEAAGQSPLRDGLLPAYGAAALAFGVAARMFRRRADDLVVAMLELASALFVAALCLLEVRQWATGGQPASPETGFIEIAMDVAALALLALFAAHLHARTGRPMLRWVARAGGGVALLGGTALLVANPAFAAMAVGRVPVFNALLPAYAIPAAAAAWALRYPAVARSPRLLPGYALVAAFVYVTLAVRHAFHPDAMALEDEPVTAAELWAWSGAWLAFGLALMATGIAKGRRGLRLAALAIVALAGAKVFLLDMGGLVGLWRVLSFLGLGLTLIALGAVYRRFVAKPAEEV